MEYSITKIASLIGADLRVRHDDTITSLLTDSRSLLEPDSTLFFALRTPSGDGHRYISQLYLRGVRNFVVEQVPEDAVSMPEANFLITESPLEALQTIASHCRRDSKATVIAITGSRGKTTVKEWIYRLISPDKLTVRSPRSFNSQTGVPLSLWQLTPDTETAIIEAGISQPGEMARLERIIEPRIGVFTNIGAAHSRDFGSIEEKCREKAQLMKRCSHVVYCADNDLIASSLPVGPERVAWTRCDVPDAMLKVTSVERHNGVTTIRYNWTPTATDGETTIPFTSERDIENALHTLTVSLLSGIAPADISTRMASLRPVNTRLEVVDGVHGCQLIHDTFSSDITSLTLALDFAHRRSIPGHSVTLIVGDLSAQGSDPARAYALAGKLARQYDINRIIAIGHEINRYADLLPLNKSIYADVDEFLKTEHTESFQDQLVLIKGSPEEPFDSIARMLEKRRHETVLEINLDAVVDNFNFFRSHIRPTTGISCMIKASGYGAGSHELAKTLQSQGATYLAVAVHDEGVDLRQAGITMPIIVLNPAVDDLSTIFDNRLAPEIYSLDFLRSLIAEATRRGIKGYPVHIKIDSGMHRLGFRLETLPEVIEVLRGEDSVVPASIFSHLCAADDPQEDNYTRGQFDYFESCCNMLLQAFPQHKILRHILNSTGITRFPERQYDMVRLGIGLYGIRTMHDGSQDALRPVSSLRTSIISLKHWPAGTTIGYNRRGLLSRNSVIATIPIGYADGLNRHLGYGNASFSVRGVKCPTVGSICMDACMIDVTGVTGVETGDRVEIFGETIPVETLSDTLGTIPYEILTSVSQRVKRVYYRE